MGTNALLEKEVGVEVELVDVEVELENVEVEEEVGVEEVEKVHNQGLGKKGTLAHFAMCTLCNLLNVENIFARFDKLALFGQMSDAAALENVNSKVDLLFLWGMHWQGGKIFSFRILQNSLSPIGEDSWHLPPTFSPIRSLIFN